MNNPVQLNSEEIEQIVEALVQHALMEVESGIIAATPFTRLAQEAVRFQPGDHLITPRKGYWHHGLYIGNHQVIHYSGGSDGAGIELFHHDSNNFKIELVSLDQFRQNQPVRIIHHPNPKHTPEEACQRARERLNEKQYSIIYSNCEHFVNWCIEGESRSDQIRRDTQGVSGITSGINAELTKRVSKKVLQVAIKTGKKLVDKLGPRALSNLGIANSSFGTAGINLSLTPTAAGALMQLGGAGLLAIAAWDTVNEQFNRTIAAKQRAEQMRHVRTTLESILDSAQKRFTAVAEQLIREKQEQIDAAFRTILDEQAPVDERVNGMNQLLKAHGAGELEYKTFEEFDRAMRESDTPPIKLKL